jgi:hypothetical protein
VAGSIDGSNYVLTVEPADASDVIAARQSSTDGQNVTLVGRIGGSTDPWIEGQAVFTIVDRSLKSCSEIPGDTCTTPWDFCCESNLGSATALIKVVNDQQQVVPVGAKELLRVAELDTVVVEGQAKRDEAGNLTVLASGIYVRK